MTQTWPHDISGDALCCNVTPLLDIWCLFRWGHTIITLLPMRWWWCDPLNDGLGWPYHRAVIELVDILWPWMIPPIYCLHVLIALLLLVHDCLSIRYSMKLYMYLLISQLAFIFGRTSPCLPLGSQVIVCSWKMVNGQSIFAPVAKKAHNMSKHVQIDLYYYVKALGNSSFCLRKIRKNSGRDGKHLMKLWNHYELPVILPQFIAYYWILSVYIKDFSLSTQH